MQATCDPMKRTCGPSLSPLSCSITVLHETFKKKTKNCYHLNVSAVKAVKMGYNRQIIVDNRKICGTPVAVVLLSTATRPSSSMWHHCPSSPRPSVCLHLSHIFSVLARRFSLATSHLSVCVSVFSSLLCLACFTDCRLKSRGQR